MSSLHAFVAVSALILYSFGAWAEINCMIAIITKTDYKSKPDLIIILSLGLANQFACIPSILGCAESLVGHFIHPYSASINGLFNSMAWICAALQMNSLAWNRFVAVVLPLRYDIICSPKITVRISLMMWITAISLASVVYFFAHPIVWDLRMVNTVFDFSQNATAHEQVGLVLWWMNIVCSLFPLFCYALVSIKLVHRNVTHAHQGEQTDLSLLIQFFIIICVFIFQNVAWNILSYVGSEYWFIVCYLSTMNFTVNGYIYLIFNKIVRQSVKKLWKIDNSVGIQAPGPAVAFSKPQQAGGVVQIVQPQLEIQSV